MRVDDFDFALPETAIALHPARPRDAARLLRVRPGQPLEDRIVRDLPAVLAPGDVLVVNDTRVVPARLHGLRRRGEAAARIEVTLHLREAADRWLAFLRPAKKVALGERIYFGPDATFSAELVAKGEGGEATLQFDRGGADLDAALDRFGTMPLPPYIAHRRPESGADAADYQTMFAAERGAVAAPTAGLHFTPALVSALDQHGISTERVTLHVGAGTFLPVKVDDTDQHRMHAEWGRVPDGVAARLNAARTKGGRIVAVGTTALRILESASTADGVVRHFEGQTSIFITPGYRFRAVDVLMTNFHLPRSTLFMLVSAFSGLDTMQAAYRHAIAAGYRFYSYGDACLLERAGTA